MMLKVTYVVVFLPNTLTQLNKTHLQLNKTHLTVQQDHIWHESIDFDIILRI
jgi:hypothetical protein